LELGVVGVAEEVGVAWEAVLALVEMEEASGVGGAMVLLILALCR
jgi:hypothetical protein